jgi:hypothetical protein
MSEANPTLTCYHCQKQIPMLGSFKITRTEDCPYCSTSLHCCRMCKFYDPTVYNECREDNAERLTDKEKANFCDYFNLSDGKNGLPSKDKLQSAADLLFKK